MVVADEDPAEEEEEEEEEEADDDVDDMDVVEELDWGPLPPPNFKPSIAAQFRMPGPLGSEVVKPPTTVSGMIP